jgi:hypothetical protein
MTKTFIQISLLSVCAITPPERRTRQRAVRVQGRIIPQKQQVRQLMRAGQAFPHTANLFRCG